MTAVKISITAWILSDYGYVIAGVRKVILSVWLQTATLSDNVSLHAAVSLHSHRFATSFTNCSLFNFITYCTSIFHNIAK